MIVASIVVSRDLVDRLKIGAVLFLMFGFFCDDPLPVF